MARDIFTIHAGERLCRRVEDDAVVEWYHSFLALSYEQDTSEPQPLQKIISQIHFVPDNLGYIQPRFYKEVLPEHLDRTTLFPLITGDPQHIAECWNHMGEFAQSLEEVDIQFGPNSRFESSSINCRTGIRETLKAGGLELHKEYTKSAAGMTANSFFLGRSFVHIRGMASVPV